MDSVKGVRFMALTSGASLSKEILNSQLESVKKFNIREAIHWRLVTTIHFVDGT